jgi:hypothetical protein
MAYVDTEHRVVILYPHKTGTHTLRKIITDNGRVANVRPVTRGTNHATLNQVKEWTSIPDVFEYEVFAFYREPIEKFLSFMAYNYRDNPTMEPVNTVMEYTEKHGYFVKQIRWLSHDIATINLLDYRHFDQELRRVLARVGIQHSDPIPRLNASNNRKKTSDLTTEEVEYIKDLYKEDYEFFDSKGIKFEV